MRRRTREGDAFDLKKDNWQANIVSRQDSVDVDDAFVWTPSSNERHATWDQW